jgi:hypothetical protein
VPIHQSSSFNAICYVLKSNNKAGKKQQLSFTLVYQEVKMQYLLFSQIRLERISMPFGSFNGHYYYMLQLMLVDVAERIWCAAP